MPWTPVPLAVPGSVVDFILAARRRGRAARGVRAAHRPRPTPCIRAGPGPQPGPHRRRRYEVAPEDHFAAVRAARADGLEVIGAYHSHPASPAEPSSHRSRPRVRRVRVRHRLAGAVAAPARLGAGRRELHRTAARPYVSDGRMLVRPPEARCRYGRSSVARIAGPVGGALAAPSLAWAQAAATPSSTRCAGRSWPASRSMPLREGVALVGRDREPPGRDRRRPGARRRHAALGRRAARRASAPMPASSCASVISTTPPCTRCSRRPRRRGTASGGAGADPGRRAPRRTRAGCPLRADRARGITGTAGRTVARPAPTAAPAPGCRSASRSTVAEDEEVTDGVIAVGGDVRIAGRVRDEVVALGGDVELLPTADVRGDITAIGGEVPIAPGARHAGVGRSRRRRAWPGSAGRRWAGRGSTSAARRAGSRSPAR